MANESITKLAEYQAMCDILAPVFRDYLKAHGTAVDEIEVATSLEGITTLPGRYSLGGVDKNVLVPLDLLTLDVRQRIDECRKATADANIAAASATTAADAANRAADRVDESVLDLTVEKAAVLKACADAEEAAARAANAATEATLAAEETTAATEDARSLMMQFTADEDARRDAEQERMLAELQRVENEEKRIKDVKKVLQGVKDATDALKELNANPPIIQGGTWWIYSLGSGSYTDTGVVAVGRSPYIDSETLNWMVWDEESQEYADSGVSAFPFNVPDEDFVDNLMKEWDEEATDEPEAEEEP